MFIETKLIKLLGGSHTEKGHNSRMESCWKEEKIQWKKEGLRRKLGVKMSEFIVSIRKLSNSKK